MEHHRELDFTEPMIEKADMPIGYKLWNRKGSNFEVEQKIATDDLLKLIGDLIFDNLRLKSL